MHVVILVTASSKKEALRIARVLVEKKLAACVNIIENIESVFRWEGKIDIAKEAMLVIKSKKTALEAIIKLVKSLHSYQVPEIIAIRIVGGNVPYLRWINESVRNRV